jgi:excisionase family DNA binding protein
MNAKDPQGWRELPVLVSLAVFCEWTGLSRNTVQKLARAGQIRSTQVGERRRYLKAEIARLGQLEWRG